MQERSFELKVITNGERNGKYFAVADLAAAQETWPHISVCHSSACSGE